MLKNVCLACNRLLFLHSSRKWEFLQLSIVIFVGEELTVIGFVREECEKTLRTGLEYLLAFGYIQTNVTTKSAIFCCVCTRKRLWQVFLVEIVGYHKDIISGKSGSIIYNVLIARTLQEIGHVDKGNAWSMENYCTNYNRFCWQNGACYLLEMN